MSINKTQTKTDRIIKKIRENRSLAYIFSESKDDFLRIHLSDHLNLLINNQKKTKSEIIQCSGINKRYLYDILSGKRDPRRDYVIRILLTLMLNLQDAQWLLKATNYPQLYARSKRDCVIIYCFVHSFDVLRCNELLKNISLNTL